MNWQSLLDPDIQKFIQTHENEDVAALALKKSPEPEWHYPAILDQIKSRQKARIKFPQWLETPDIILPAPNIIEQASSSATALYKSRLVEGENFVDLTGGVGVDSWAMAQNFKRGITIDIDKNNANLLAHNLNALCACAISVENISAEDFIQTMDKTDLCIIDPARRNAAGKGRYKFEDCAPNLIEILASILDKSRVVMVKTSPMLDITEGINALKYVQAVHILEWRGDCKELIFLLNKSYAEAPIITAASIDDHGNPISTFSFTQNEEETTDTQISLPLIYLYEPGPAFQKSGGFKTLAKRFDVKKLHTHTHLYTSDTPHKNFPGRVFEILGQYPAQAGKIPLKKANLTVRNFPMGAQDLRKKLKIQDGGKDYLFACTNADNDKILLHCKKHL